MRNRSMALVVRNDKILMIKTFRFNRYIWKLPGGGIEIGETAEEAAPALPSKRLSALLPAASAY